MAPGFGLTKHDGATDGGLCEQLADICCSTTSALHSKDLTRGNGVDNPSCVELRRRSCRRVGREENHNVVSGGLNCPGVGWDLTFTNLNNDKEIACLNKHPIVKFIHCPLVFNAP
jgi:hypothetical protein